MPLATATSRTVTLAGETDLAGFRRACRALVASQVPPEQVSWHVADASSTQGLFDDEPPTAGAHAAPLRVPAAFATLCDEVLPHADPQRFGLLYRYLWRLLHDPALRGDPLDADRVALDGMARVVRREMHKMTAFVRFRRIEDDDGEWHVAWFEPAHHVVEAVAPFFVRRFANMRWAILTPERSVRWDGRSLDFGPGARREDAPPADAGEALWLTYYRHIFNPARLKVAMMVREMPRRYWPNLPEAPLIAPLVAQAAPRTEGMIRRAPEEPHRRVVRIGPAEPPRPRAVAAARTLADLAAAENACRDCPIGEHATQAVPGAGAARATLMLVGEQPGDQEDLRGQPFVGPAGQLLDRAIAQLGWQRERLYVTNAVKHFKFELRGKRRMHKTPAQQEAAICAQWLEREIELVQPQAIVALGATAARTLLGRAVAVLKERGTWQARADGRPVLVTLHPSALLRMQADDPAAEFARWVEDLRIASRHAGGE